MRNYLRRFGGHPLHSLALEYIVFLAIACFPHPAGLVIGVGGAAWALVTLVARYLRRIARAQETVARAHSTLCELASLQIEYLERRKQENAEESRQAP